MQRTHARQLERSYFYFDSVDAMFLCRTTKALALTARATDQILFTVRELR